MEANCNSYFATKNSSAYCFDTEGTLLDDFQDESLKLISVRSSWSLLLTMALIGCAAMNFAGKIFIIWYVKFQSIKRPLNTLIILDQVSQILPVLISGIGASASLTLNEPMFNYVGQLGCRLWFYFDVTHFLSLSIGGAGMAAYRLAIYKLAHRISDCKGIRNIILLVEAITFLALFATLTLTTLLIETIPPMDFCHGHTYVSRKVFNAYNGADQGSIKLAIRMASFGITLTSFVTLVEMICYVVLFYWKKWDTFKETPRSKNLAKIKYRQNAITLSGQITCFIIENTFIILYMVMRKTTEWEYLQHGYIPIYVTFMWFGITLTQIITSREMRSFILSYFASKLEMYLDMDLTFLTDLYY